MFKKYQHLERLGTSEVEDINIGTVYVFPKLDGTNGSIWMNEDGSIGSGSRNRDLSDGKDNAGFNAHVQEDQRYKSFYTKYGNKYRLFGEWLVPHSLKTYRDEAWREFYVFDVVLDEDDGYTYVNPEVYQDMLAEHGIAFIPWFAKVKNGSDEKFRSLLEKNSFLLKEGEGIGEGIVLKNYEFTNKYGRTVWAKVIDSKFKEEHVKVMGGTLEGGRSVEEKIIDEWVTQHLVDKTEAKIRVLNDNEGQPEWSSKDIPRLLGMVFHDLITEDIWDILKKEKNPKIDFKFLQRLSIAKIKELKQELFS